MKKRLVFIILTVILIMPQAFAGGKSDTGSRELTIAFCFQDLETEFWVASYKAITETLAANGIKVIEKNAHEDASRQLEQVKDSIFQGVDGVIIIPQDGESAVAIARECNKAGVPVGVFNRPPSDRSARALVVMANNEMIAEQAVEHMAREAMKLGRKVTPAIMVGDPGDPNTVKRRHGFYKVIRKYPELWTGEPVEIPTRWDANIALANLQSTMQAYPDIDFLFTSSDFLFPVIKAVLAPLGKWQKIGDRNHVILGGLDGDKTACGLLNEGYLDSTGVQNLFVEAKMMLNAMLKAIEAGETQPDEWMLDSGFTLTQVNLKERAQEMWGCKILAEE